MIIEVFIQGLDRVGFFLFLFYCLVVNEYPSAPGEYVSIWAAAILLQPINQPAI